MIFQLHAYLRLIFTLHHSFALERNFVYTSEVYQSNGSSSAPRIWQTEGGARPGDKGVWGRSPKPPINFLRFSHKKTLILAHFFIEKEHAVSAATIDYAKIYSQLMPKSRYLAKISERRLQPLLV